MRSHDDQISLPSACFFLNHLEGATRGYRDVAGGRLAEARGLIFQVILGCLDLLTAPFFWQVVLDHMQNAEHRTRSLGQLHSTLDGEL